MKKKTIGLLTILLLLTLSCTSSFLLRPTPAPNELNANGVVQIVPAKDMFVSGLVWSPDSTKIAISYSRVGVESASLFQIYLLDVQSGKMNLLEESKQGVRDVIAWLPDDRIGFYAGGDLEEGTWLISSDGKGRRILVAKDVVAALSPDGQMFAYWKSESEQNIISISLYVNDLVSRSEKRIFRINSKFILSGLLKWSPDGNEILFLVGFSDVSLDDMFDKGLILYKINLLSESILKLSSLGQGSTIWWPPTTMKGFADWSPDTTLVVFTYWKSHDPSRNGLYVMQTDGNCIVRIVNSENEDIQAVSWSPNGRWIAFGWNGAIYLLDTFEVLGEGYTKYYSMCP